MYMFFIFYTVGISQVIDQVLDLESGYCEVSADYGDLQSFWFMCPFQGSQFSNQLVYYPHVTQPT